MQLEQRRRGLKVVQALDAVVLRIEVRQALQPTQALLAWQAAAWALLRCQAPWLVVVWPPPRPLEWLLPCLDAAPRCRFPGAGSCC